MQRLLLGNAGRNCLRRRGGGSSSSRGGQLDLSGHCQHCALEPDKAVLHAIELDLHTLARRVLRGKPLVLASQVCVLACEDVEAGCGVLEARAEGVVLLALALP